ncbi:MAG: HAMP domain-containing histidine kinase [Clostridiales Family XIII bacterium]|nr:HAMP domain-containing histidine kinase [Clostridiales Family XIII bacterium]
MKKSEMAQVNEGEMRADDDRRGRDPENGDGGADGDGVKRRFGDRPGARAAVFLLCVLLGVSGIAAGLIGLSSAHRKLSSLNNYDYPFDIYSVRGISDLLSDKPYVQTHSFIDKAGQDAFIVVRLCNSYRDGAGMTNATGFYEKEIQNIYYMLADPENPSYYDWSNDYIITAQAGEGIVEIPLGENNFIAFEAKKMYGDDRIFSPSGDAADDEITADTPEGRRAFKVFKAGRAAFEEIYADELAQLKDYRSAEYKKATQESYDDALADLDKSGLAYYIDGFKGSEQAITNITPDTPDTPVDPAVLLTYPVYLSVEFDGGGGWEIGESSGLKGTEFSEGWLIDIADSFASSSTLYVAWPQTVVDKGAAILAMARDEAQKTSFYAIAALIASFALLVLLLAWTGRKRADGTRRLYAWDRVFIEIQLAVMLLTVLSGFGLGQMLPPANTWMDFEFVVLIGICVAAGAVCLWCLLSFARIIKAGRFTRRLLIGALLRLAGLGIRELGRAVKSGFDGRNPLAKTVVLVVLLWLVAMITSLVVVSFHIWYLFEGIFAALLVLSGSLVLALYFSVKWVKRYGELKRGVEEIAGGNLSYKIPVEGAASNEFEKLSVKINEIGGGAAIAVQNELKNQRLKTDLISNVSHDLKTPLTSIITYTDILKKEGLDSENAAGYLEIIEEKSRRLKKLTEDLFEAAKASSGAMPVHCERVDLLSLIGQELVEHGDGLAGIDLQVVVGAAKEHYYVKADSQLLWRVVDNLLNNVRKYALPGSRVYIDLKESPPAGKTSLEIKNTSAAMLNIPADELMERFQRGDESRATEGSGLGLSIAGDLARLMNGTFEIAIDGDLFKASVTLASME